MNLEAQARMMENGKRFVWWSTPESRAAGRISVLAIAETFFAVALYWWIAFHFDTHLHLVTSLLVAPLLLLRSEKSIEVGVDWFLRDWFDFEHYEEWSRVRKAMWLGVPAFTRLCWQLVGRQPSGPCLASGPNRPGAVSSRRIDRSNRWPVGPCDWNSYGWGWGWVCGKGHHDPAGGNLTVSRSRRHQIST